MNAEAKFPKTPAACADFLRNYNQWRRGDKNITQPDPTQIGLALTMAAGLIDTQPSEGPFTDQQKNMILRDMVNVFQEQFDQIDTLLGLPVNDCTPSDINRTLAAISTLLPNRIDHPWTDRKAQSVIKRGYKITGYTLTNDTGQKCIVDGGAVRWFTEGSKFTEVMHPSDIAQENLKIGQEIQRAAGELPDNVEIEITVEKGACTVRLIDDEGDLRYFDIDEYPSSAISAAIDAAKGGKS